MLLPAAAKALRASRQVWLAPWIPSPEQSFVEKAANSPRQILDPDWIDQDPIRDPAAATELLFHDCDHATLQTLRTDLAAG